MTTQTISIKEAAELAGKSPQTIRRLLKSKKIKFKKIRTPQGFNYDIDKASVMEFYGLTLESQAVATPQAEATTNVASSPVTPSELESETVNQLINKREHRVLVDYAPVKEFNDTLQILMKQHSKEKENLFKLVEAFQNKVVTLETKLSSREQNEKRWYKFW